MKKIRVKQRDISDCGAACLASVAAFYHLHLPIGKIRQMAGTDQSGTSLFGLAEAAGKMNFLAKGVRISDKSLSGIPMPAIFHLVPDNGMQHFVVAYTMNAKRIRYMDPATGNIIKKSPTDFKKDWSGVILLVLPSEYFQTGNEKKPIILRFWQLIQPHRNLYIQALIGAILYTLLGLATSVYVRKLVDDVLPDGDIYLMNILGAGMIVLLFFQVITGYFKSLSTLRTGQQIDAWLILGYYNHLLKLPQRFFDSMRVGEIISRVNDALRIRLFINDVALQIVLQFCTMILSVSAMFIFNWKLALLMLASVPVYLIIYRISNGLNKKWQRKIMENGAALESQLVETVQGISTIRRYGAENYFLKETEKKFIPLLKAIFISSRSSLLIAAAAEWLTGFLMIVLLWTGSSLVIRHILTTGELFSFYTLLAFFTTPVQTLIAANKSMQDALIAADRLFEIMDLETENKIIDKGSVERFPEGDLVFKQVHFGFRLGRPLFEGLDLRIARNQITGIIGGNGTGKSTLVTLIQKIYLPDKGSIYVGDLDLLYLSTSILRQKIVSVPQKTDLFQGTVISNIALGVQQPDMERITNICQRLGLDSFLNQLPEQYQTLIREQGANLSGGQKQLLGIARALYTDPEILILDEASSALDPESERKVQQTLEWFFEQGRTVIMITHRLSAIRQCDSVIFLRGGPGPLYGCHEQLLSENPEYSWWWKENV